MPNPPHHRRPHAQRGPRGPAPRRARGPANGRHAACQALRQHAERFPDLLPDPSLTDGLDPREAGFAHAITDAATRRWLTLTFLLGRHTNGPLDRLEPGVLAALLAGSAQLVLLDRVPPHAAIHETVEWVKRRVRARAGGLVNAVLRRIAELAPSDVEPRAEWTDAPDELLLADGRARVLSGPVLPESESDRVSITTSVPLRVFTEWADELGWKQAKELAYNALSIPPLVLNASHAGEAFEHEHASAHDDAGFYVFDGPRESLTDLLRARSDIWVQDPGSARSVGVAAGLSPKRIFDICAGRGTKTRQLRAMFPDAEIVASDTDQARGEDFVRMAHDTGMQGVSWAEPEELDDLEPADLVLLDVPCSNSGVLARRPEARYRLGKKQTKRLTRIQNGLIERGAALCAPKGHVVYATCSIDEVENGARAQTGERVGLRETARRQTLPAGVPGDPATAHRDGGFAVLLERS
ncbi:MAG: transcription antitermination factor NusB [Planctomycetota bacterium]